jgi:hypothetical protein
MCWQGRSGDRVPTHIIYKCYREPHNTIRRSEGVGVDGTNYLTAWTARVSNLDRERNFSVLQTVQIGSGDLRSLIFNG